MSEIVKPRLAISACLLKNDDQEFQHIQKLSEFVDWIAICPEGSDGEKPIDVRAVIHENQLIVLENGQDVTSKILKNAAKILDGLIVDGFILKHASAT